MEVVRELDTADPGGAGHALTIGFYDGVHLGHRTVIDATRASAARHGIKTGVVTFDPHPASLLRPESAPRLLTDLDQKLDLLEAAGVDTVVVVGFDAEQATETAERFVERVVVDGLRARSVIVGGDFHFGKDRAGNVDLLAKLGERHGFEVEGLQLLGRAGADSQSPSISSTAVRQAVAAGDVTGAAEMLGRHHEIRGPVTTGDRRGRTIGFPTANVAVGLDMAMPADGVYAGVYVRPDGSRWPSAINIGKRPTFYEDAEHSLLEVHLIDFDGDLYGEAARVQFVVRLRGEQRFDGIEALSAQLQTDVAAAAEVIAAIEA